MRYLVYVRLPGKMINWKRGSFRTPLRLIMLNDKELEEMKIRLKAAGIMPHQYEVTELDEKEEKKEVKVEKSDKSLKELKREAKEDKKSYSKKPESKKSDKGKDKEE